MPRISDRFEIAELLGAGGMGEVYKAYDKKLRTHVALKKLPHLSPDKLLRFKREFRNQSSIHHPNLVRLGELFQSDETWYFSMEYVEGSDLLAYIASGPESEFQHLPTEPLEPTSRSRVRTSAFIPSFSEARLRASLSQLIEAAHALHVNGKIHRDIKPSNIIVTKDGRLVLLDYGLVTDKAASYQSNVLGTPAYMAPEMAEEGATLTEATDWYSIGVILFSILAGGNLPFTGTPMNIILNKTQKDPPAIQSFWESCPEELASVCMALLSRQPELRPRYEDLVRLFGTPLQPAVVVAKRGAGEHFVGRREELGELAEIYTSRPVDRCLLVELSGESGIGKSALATTFLAAHLPSDCLIFRGRCYAQESVSFKAFDELVDMIANYLNRLRSEESALYVPYHVDCLLKVFPVLGRISTFNVGGASGHSKSRDSAEVRVLAFDAFVELLSRIAKVRNIILFVDDFQWSDKDSVDLLRHILRHREAPPVLFLISTREQLKKEQYGGLANLHRIKLGPLSLEESMELAERLSKADPERSHRSIIKEANGHPFLIREFLRDLDEEEAESSRRLDSLIWRRLASLPQDSIDIIKVLSVVGAPVSTELLNHVLQIPNDDIQQHASLMASASIVSRCPGGQFLYYHDGIRETVLLNMTEDELIPIHTAIANFHRERSASDSVALLTHLMASGNQEEAYVVAMSAARISRSKYAFEQALSIIVMALQLERISGEQRTSARVEMAEVLVLLGRRHEAAHVYMAAAASAPESTKPLLEVAAAHQLMISGHRAEGQQMMSELFGAYGMQYPRTPKHALMLIIGNRIRLLFKKLKLKRNETSRLDPVTLGQLTLCKAGCQGLVLVDPFRSAFFAGSGLLLALKAGSPDFLQYFLLIEGGIRRSSNSASAERYVDAFNQVSRQFPSQVVSADVLAVHQNVWVFQQMQGGDLDAYNRLVDAEAHLSAANSAPWEIVAARTFILGYLRRLGRYNDMRAKHEEYLRDATYRNDQFTKVNVDAMGTILALADDDVASAKAVVERYDWGREHHDDYTVQSWYVFISRVEIALYEGEAMSLRWIRRQLKAYNRAGFDKLSRFICQTQWLLARLALRFPALFRNNTSVLRIAISRMEAMGYQHPRLLATLLGSALHSSRDPARCRRMLREVIHQSRGLDLRMLEAAARVRLGTVFGEPSMTEHGLGIMKEENIRVPMRFIDMLAPGFEEAGPPAVLHGNRKILH